jgi:hypothetical protein
MLDLLFTIIICGSGQDITCFYHQTKPEKPVTVNHCLKRGECNGRQDIQKN